MMKGTKGTLLLAALLPLAAARPACAWDRETHKAVVRAAMAVSPAFRARIPEGRLELLLDAAGEPDFFDPECRTHHTPPAEPSREAVRALDALRARKTKGGGIQEAMLFGKLLHFTADCVVPRRARTGGFTSLSLAVNDIVVFRTPRPISGDVGESLRRRGEDALWADDVPQAISAIFRDAVDATIDVAMLLPSRSSEPVPDQGPVLFATRRVFHVSNKPTIKGVYADYDPGFTAFYRALTPVAESTGNFPEFAARDVHVLEVVPHAEGKNQRLRVLLLNNQGLCEHHEILGNPNWFTVLPGNTPGLSLRILEVPGTGDPPEHVFALGTRGTCAEGPSEGRAIPLESISVYLLWSSDFPDFKKPTAQCRIPRTERPTGRYDVDFDLAAVQKGLPGAFLSLMQVRTEKDSWIFTTEFSVRWDAEWVAMPMLLDVEATGAGAPVRYTLRIDPRRSEDYLRFETSVPERTARFSNPRFRLLAIHPDIRPVRRLPEDK